jgi:hypothetical protein
MKQEQNLEKRLYVFPHFMLGQIAKGIQSLHSTTELFNEYYPCSEDNVETVLVKMRKEQYKILHDWSTNHKTCIMLNPGVSENLDELKYVLQDPNNFYPWAVFCEDEYSLKGLMTSISIVLTEKIYNTAALFRTRNFVFSEQNLGLINCLDTSKVSVDDLEKIKSYGRFNQFEMDMVITLNKCRLAQ